MRQVLELLLLWPQGEEGEGRGRWWNTTGWEVRRSKVKKSKHEKVQRTGTFTQWDTHFAQRGGNLSSYTVIKKRMITISTV